MITSGRRICGLDKVVRRHTKNRNCSIDWDHRAIPEIADDADNCSNDPVNNNPFSNDSGTGLLLIVPALLVHAVFVADIFETSYLGDD
jgi:hypothetical protein